MIPYKMQYATYNQSKLLSTLTCLSVDRWKGSKTEERMSHLFASWNRSIKHIAIEKVWVDDIEGSLVLGLSQQSDTFAHPFHLPTHRCARRICTTENGCSSHLSLLLQRPPSKNWGHLTDFRTEKSNPIIQHIFKGY